MANLRYQSDANSAQLYSTSVCLPDDAYAFLFWTMNFGPSGY